MVEPSMRPNKSSLFFDIRKPHISYGENSTTHHNYSTQNGSSADIYILKIDSCSLILYFISLRMLLVISFPSVKMFVTLRYCFKYVFFPLPLVLGLPKRIYELNLSTARFPGNLVTSTAQLNALPCLTMINDTHTTKR